MHDEATLISRGREGDQDALSELLYRYQDRIYSYLFRILNNHHDAEEVTQETFVKAIRGLKKYKEQGHFKSWLYKIAYYEGLRKLGRRDFPVDEENQPELVDDKATPDESMLSGERMAELEDAIMDLPEGERQVVLLRAYSGLSFREIAEIMGSPLNTALGRMHNAKTRLRNALA